MKTKTQTPRVEVHHECRGEGDLHCAAPVPGGCKDADGKPRPVFAKGLCEPHFRRQNRDPKADLARPVAEKRGELVELKVRIPAGVAPVLEALAAKRKTTVYRLAGQLIEAGPDLLEAVVRMRDRILAAGNGERFEQTTRRDELAVAKADRALEKAGGAP